MKCEGRCWKCLGVVRKVVTFLISHIGLVALVVGYCIAGAFTFERLEKNWEKEKKMEMMDKRVKVENFFLNFTVLSSSLRYPCSLFISCIFHCYYNKFANCRWTLATWSREPISFICFWMKLNWKFKNTMGVLALFYFYHWFPGYRGPLEPDHGRAGCAKWRKLDDSSRTNSATIWN